LWHLTFYLALLPLSLVMPPSPPGNPATNDRTIRKEPAYRTNAPKYGLLVFGPQGKDRVWLVLDGNTLYVDRNGNGDLTEPSKKVVAENRPGHDAEEDGYSFDVGELTVSGRTHKGLSVSFVPLKRYAKGSAGERPDVKATLVKDPTAVAVTLSVYVEVPGIQGGGVGGRVSFLAGPIDLNGVLQFANRPAQAPAVRLGGPLEVTFSAERPTVRVGREGEFVLVVGTPGIGPGTFATVGYDGTIPEGAKPVAEISCSVAKAGAPPVKQKFEIAGRC
jgi:hypothetical protein